MLWEQGIEWGCGDPAAPRPGRSTTRHRMLTRNRTFADLTLLRLLNLQADWPEAERQRLGRRRGKAEIALPTAHDPVAIFDVYRAVTEIPIMQAPTGPLSLSPSDAASRSQSDLQRQHAF